MSKYTTGEIAKLCGVSVRTVQYYDTRELLVPSELSEGGRRLYSEDDFRKMKLICFLREMGMPINSINELFREEDPNAVINILLERQEQLLRDEINEKQAKLMLVEELKNELKSVEQLSVKALSDIAMTMENKLKMKKVRKTMILATIPVLLAEIAVIALWVATQIWWPFAVVYGVVVIPFSIWISWYYYKNTAYICPKCNEVFKPGFKEMFFANHTPTTRKLTCSECGHKGFCVETYGGK